MISSYKNKNFICFGSFPDTTNPFLSSYSMLKLGCNDKQYDIGFALEISIKR